jgi:hypothetical protein
MIHAIRNKLLLKRKENVNIFIFLSHVKYKWWKETGVLKSY